MIEETIFGMYSFENDTRVDVVKRDVGGDVVRHEHTHGFISTFSSIGLLLIMMRKAFIVTTDKYWLYEELCRSIREVQEITATIVEYYSIWENRGKNAFDSAIRALYKNKEYRRYYDALYDIHKQIRSVAEAKNFVQQLQLIAIISMNIDFTGFPIWTFENAKDLTAFFEKTENRERYHPRSRFNTLISYELRKKQDEAMQRKYAAVSDATLDGDITQHCNEIVRRIYRNSDELDRIIERVSTISISPEKVKIFDEGVNVAALQAYPADLNDSELRRDYAFGSLEYGMSILLNDPNTDLIFCHPLSGYENQKMLLCAGTLREITMCPYDDSDIPMLLERVPNQIAFTRWKLYSRVKELLQQRKRKVYILVDTAIAGSLDFVYKEFSGCRYTYFIEDDCIMLLFFNGLCTLIQPIAPEAKQELTRILDDKGIQFVHYEDSGYYKNQTAKRLARINRDMAVDALIFREYIEQKLL